MQPAASANLLLPTADTSSSELISKSFDAVAKHCDLAERYGFGPKSNIIKHLKEKWDKVIVQLTITVHLPLTIFFQTKVDTLLPSQITKSQTGATKHATQETNIYESDTTAEDVYTRSSSTWNVLK